VNQACAGGFQGGGLRYWRDKQGHEVDLVRAPRGRAALPIECKWSAHDFAPADLLVFARPFPKFELVVACTGARPAFVREFGGAVLSSSAWTGWWSGSPVRHDECSKHLKTSKKGTA
jgi:hypothetical protein